MNRIYIITILLGIALLSSCTTNSTVLGHWKCDSTGTITTTHNGKTIEFRDDGIMIQHQRKTNEGYKKAKGYFYPNYKGDQNEIIVSTNNGEDENIITI